MQGKESGWPRACTGGYSRRDALPVILVVNGAAGLLTEAGVSFGVVEVELMEVEVPELVDGEAKFPGNVA